MKIKKEKQYVKYADDDGIEHSARQYQKEPVLAMHGDRLRILNFQKKLGSTKRCSAVAVSLPLKKAELVFIRIVL